MNTKAILSMPDTVQVHGIVVMLTSHVLRWHLHSPAGGWQCEYNRYKLKSNSHITKYGYFYNFQKL